MNYHVYMSVNQEKSSKILLAQLNTARANPSEYFVGNKNPIVLGKTTIKLRGIKAGMLFLIKIFG